MKQRTLKNRILLLVLALLLLIPTSITLAKYTAVNNVGTVRLAITGDPTVLDAGWKSKLDGTPTALVVDRFDKQSGNLNGGEWDSGTPIGAKTGGNFTNGVRLFEVGNTAYILARDSNAVEFPANSSRLFFNLNSIKTIQFNNINTAHVTTMESMFLACRNLTSLDLRNFNTAQVTDMMGMFFGCNALTSLNLRSFNTEQVTNMALMFGSCSALTSLDLSSFKTAQVTNMMLMFLECNALTSLDLSSFKTAQVTSMENMFSGCNALTSLDLSSFNTEQVTTMQSMFDGCSALTSVDLSSFNTEKVTTMEAMFQGCEALPSLDLRNFNTEQVTTMKTMFGNCSALTSLDLSSFITKKVTDMTAMFAVCNTLKEVTLGEKFKFVGTNGYLPDPYYGNIPDADGYWYYLDSNNAVQVLSNFGVADRQNKGGLSGPTTYYAVKSEASAASGTGYSLRSPAAAPDQDAGLSGGQNLTDPVTPVTPIDPAAPVDPVNPVTPVAPTDPEDPADPDDPVTTGEETGTGASQDNPTTTE